MEGLCVSGVRRKKTIRWEEQLMETEWTVCCLFKSSKAKCCIKDWKPSERATVKQTATFWMGTSFAYLVAAEECRLCFPFSPLTLFLTRLLFQMVTVLFSYFPVSSPASGSLYWDASHRGYVAAYPVFPAYTRDLLVPRPSVVKADISISTELEIEWDFICCLRTAVLPVLQGSQEQVHMPWLGGIWLKLPKDGSFVFWLVEPWPPAGT